jgi:hypothetical protein
MNQKSYMKKPPARAKIISATTTDAGTYEGVALAALEISRRRTEKLKAIKAALLAGDSDTALGLMRGLLGLYELDDEGGRCEERAQ